MDLYHIWCDLKPGVKDSVLVEAARKYLGYLKSEGSIENWRLTFPSFSRYSPRSRRG